MSSLFNISSRYASVLKLIDDYTDWEPDTDAEGHYLDENNEIIDDLVEYRQQLTDALLDTLDAVDGEMADKLANCGAFVKQLTAEAGALDTEIKSLRQRSASKKREIERFKKYIMDCMINADVKKVDEPLAKLTIRQNAESVEVADELGFIDWAQRNDRDDLLRYSTPDINKTAVKDAIRSGTELPGAQIVRTKSLIIK
jgi:hypothetical protein